MPTGPNTTKNMTTSIKKLVKSFPHPHIPVIEGPPNYETIMDVTHLLNAEDPSIHSKLGGGSYGHLVLTTFTASYATLLPVPFIAPANPGTTPVIPPPPPTSDQWYARMMKASASGSNTTR
jgi:hypothetical protein